MIFIRTRYEVSELISTQQFTQFNIGSEGYAVTNRAYTTRVIGLTPVYKFHKGRYQRCYGLESAIESHLRMEAQKEWYAS